MNGPEGRTGARIRELRRQLGLSQKRIAERIGVSQQTIHKWESSKTIVAAAYLDRLAAQLKVAPAYLAGRAEPDSTLRPREVDLYAASPEGLDLLRAMLKLDDPVLRRGFIDLIEAVGAELQRRRRGP